MLVWKLCSARAVAAFSSSIPLHTFSGNIVFASMIRCGHGLIARYRVNHTISYKVFNSKVRRHLCIPDAHAKLVSTNCPAVLLFQGSSGTLQTNFAILRWQVLGTVRFSVLVNCRSRCTVNGNRILCLLQNSRFISRFCHGILRHMNDCNHVAGNKRLTIALHEIVNFKNYNDRISRNNMIELSIWHQVP